MDARTMNLFSSNNYFYDTNDSCLLLFSSYTVYLLTIFDIVIMNQEVLVDFYATSPGLDFTEQSRNVRHDPFLQDYSNVIG